MNWMKKLEEELNLSDKTGIRDVARESHLRKMADLQSQHGGKDCLCDGEEICMYHLCIS